MLFSDFDKVLILFIFLLVGSILFVSAVSVDVSKPFHVLQQISKSTTDLNSVDSDKDGYVDFANSAYSAVIIKCPDGTYKEAKDCGLASNVLPVCASGKILKRSGSLWLCADDVNAPISCSANQVMKWSGSAWVCASDEGIVKPTTCASGQVLKWNGSAWVCVNDGLVAPSPCASGQVLKWSGSAWVCASDEGIVKPTTCGSGQVLKWSGSAWVCQNDSTGAALPTCNNGQILKYNNGWTCGNDIDTDTKGTLQCEYKATTVWVGESYYTIRCDSGFFLTGGGIYCDHGIHSVDFTDDAVLMGMDSTGTYIKGVCEYDKTNDNQVQVLYAVCCKVV